MGDVGLDGIREISGGMSNITGWIGNTADSTFGVFDNYYAAYNRLEGSDSSDRLYGYGAGYDFYASRQLPVSSVTRPRSFGVLACAYLGQPAS